MISRQCPALESVEASLRTPGESLKGLLYARVDIFTTGGYNAAEVSYLYVTLPPEMSHIATRSFLGVQALSQRRFHVSILAFQRNPIFPVCFLHKKNPTCYTQKTV